MQRFSDDANGNPAQSAASTRIARILRLSGSVQGIGMRPAILRLACDNQLCGWVRNRYSQIELWIEGCRENVDAFLFHLHHRKRLPGFAILEHEQAVFPRDYSSFFIEKSDGFDECSTDSIPQDRVTCQQCRLEFRTPGNRREAYSLISCNDCGPRLTILETLPFDRNRTSMKQFDYCSDCEQEYGDAENRRCHSQTIACSRCGPQVTGLREGIDALQRNEIVGLKGIGGYQWIASASSDIAVKRLRRWKCRPRKPFAVMIDHDDIHHWVTDPKVISRILQSDGSIIIVAKNLLNMEWVSHLSVNVQNEMKSLGIMMPTSMLHCEIVQQVGALVVSSANQDGEPMAIELNSILPDEKARSKTSFYIIDHNRPIQQRMDDSVVLAYDSGFLTVRPARGLTPNSWSLKDAGWKFQPEENLSPVLSLGAHQKNSLAWSDGRHITLGSYLGDTDSLKVQEEILQQWKRIQELYRFEPSLIAHDLHPEFFTTHWGEQVAQYHSIKNVPIQHHRAHWYSSLLEPGWLDRQVLGFVWDGTGLGEDGSIWGSECFVGDISGQKRVATLLPFSLPGGEAAIKEPWRIALSLCQQIDSDHAFEKFKQLPVKPLRTMIHKSLNSVVTSSMGRLFDGVAAILLAEEIASRPISYEGELAQLLEECCDVHEMQSYEIPLMEAKTDSIQPRLYLDWRVMLRQVIDDAKAEVAVGKMAMRFHRALANAIRNIAKLYPQVSLTFSGGCFQNRILLHLVQELEMEKNRNVAWPGRIPVNDSGIAIGQTLAALAGQAHDRRYPDPYKEFE